MKDNILEMFSESPYPEGNLGKAPEMLLYDQIDSTNDKPLRPETRIAVKRALADAVLTLSARVVMAYLLMDHPQAVKRAACPPLYVTAAALGLCSRTVQRAYDELERAGWLDDSRGGPDDLPEAGDDPERHRLLHQPPGSLPARRAAPPSLPPPTLSQQIEGYEVLRERALALNKVGIALRAHSELGRTMGYDRPKREREALPEVAAKAGNGWQEQAPTGTAPVTAGAAPAETGSNWHELADLGAPGTPPEPAQSGYFFKPVSDLAWNDPVARAPEIARADAEWEDYCRTRNAERRRMGLEPDMPVGDTALELPPASESDKFSTLDRRPPAAAAPGPI